MTIKVDQETCIGCAMCVDLCKNVFEMDEEEAKAKVISQKEVDSLKEAIESCPVDAISM